MKPSKAFSSRYTRAKKWRNQAEPYIREIFKHCCPGRETDFDTKRTASTFQPDVDVFHSLPEELASDLASDLVTYFTPSEERWLTQEIVQRLPKDVQDQVFALVSDNQDDLFSLIESSNYNDMAPQWAFESATHGTPAIWLTGGTTSNPLHFESVPPHELLVLPGHMGILDRFRERYIEAEFLPAELHGEFVDLSDERIQRKMDKPGLMVRLCYGFWLDWSDPMRPMWMQEITVDNICVSRNPADEGETTTVNLGDFAGNCPLLVGRFFPQPQRPWGRGAGWRALPDIRTLDEVEDLTLTAMEESIKRTIIYPDDGFIDLEDGLETGRSYSANRGFTRDQIYEMPPITDINNAYFTRDDFEKRLTRLFYQDGPRQTGDTPPTATQWVDQRRRVQQRLGRISAPLWSELILPMVQRAELLGARIGRVKEVLTHDGQAIKTKPISPLQKAQQNDQIMASRSNVQMAFETLGEGVGEVIDMQTTIQNHLNASGDRLTTLQPAQGRSDGSPPAAE